MIYNKVSLADVHVSVVDPLSVRSYIHPLYTYNIAPYTNTITVKYNKVSLADDHVSVLSTRTCITYGPFTLIILYNVGQQGKYSSSPCLKG